MITTIYAAARVVSPLSAPRLVRTDVVSPLSAPRLARTEIAGVSVRAVNGWTLPDAARGSSGLASIGVYEATSSWGLGDNPYCAALWPASVAAARRVAALAENRTVLELGAGVGLASLVAAAAGAREVVCTDIAPVALALTRAAADDQGLGSRVATHVFDATSDWPLPPAELVVLSDLTYDETLATHAARRVLEARARGSEVVVVGNPLRPARCEFLRVLEEADAEHRMVFERPVVIDLGEADLGRQQRNWKTRLVEVMHLPR